MQDNPHNRSSYEYNKFINSKNTRNIMQNNVARAKNSNNSKKTLIEKYRNTLNLPCNTGQKSFLKKRQGKITISDQTAKLIALSLKGLLNS